MSDFGGQTVRQALNEKRRQMKGKVEALYLCKGELFYSPDPPGDKAQQSVYPVSWETALKEAKFFGVEVHPV